MKNKIAKNYLYNLVYNALNLIVPFITIPYVTRIIKPNQMGIFSSSQALFLILIVLAGYGVSSYGTREIAIYSSTQNEKTNKKLLLQHFRRIFNTQVFTTFVSLIICLVMVYLITDESIRAIYLINTFMILYEMFNIAWFYNGLEEFKITVTRNIFVKLFGVVLILVFVKTPDDLPIYASIYILSALIGNLTMFLSLKKYLGTYNVFSYKWIDFKTITKGIPYMMPLFVTRIYANFGVLAVYRIAGELHAGIYDQAIRIIRMLMIITLAFTTVVSPRMAKFYSQKLLNRIKHYFSKSISFLLVPTFLIITGIMVVGNEFINFFMGSEYAAVAPILQWMSFYMIAYMFDRSFNSLLLTPLGKTKTLLYTNLISLSLNFILSILLIPKFGVIGATLAITVSTFFSVILKTYQCREYVLFKPIFGNLLIVSISSVITIFSLKIFKQYFDLAGVQSFFIYGLSCVVIFLGIILMIGKDLRSFLIDSIVDLFKFKST